LPSYPHIVSSVAPIAATGVTLQRYRRRLADELGFWMETSATVAASAGDTTRIVLADELRDDEVGYDFLGTWLYARTGVQGGTQRRIVSQPDAGYLGPMGGLTLSRPFDAALVGGSVIEVTSPLPIKRHLGVKGIDDLVNEGLLCSRVKVLLEITGNGGYAYALDAYPWLFHEGQTGGIYDAAYLVVSDPPMRNPSSTYRIESDGVTRRLITEGHSYAADETFFLEAFVRADLLVYDPDTATWGFTTTPGLPSDLWQAAAPEHWVVAFGMVKGLDYLMRLIRQRKDLSKEDKAEYMAEILDRKKVWYRAARRIQSYELPRPPAVRSEPMVGVSNPYGWVTWP
jgi:hypothetical protein